MTTEIYSATSETFIDWPDTVPLSVQDKFETIRNIAQSRHAALQAVLDETKDVREAQAKDQSELRWCEERRDPSLKFKASQLRLQIDKRVRPLNKLLQRQDELRQASQPARALSDRLERYLRQNSSACMRMYDGDAAKLANGETALEGFDRAARRVRMLQADRDEVLAAPFPTSVAKREALKQLSLRAEASKPSVTSLIERIGEIRYSTAKLEVIVHNQVAPDVYGIDPVGLLAWLFPTEMQAAIDREIDAVGEDDIALSAEERLQRLKQIDSDILASEREEAAFGELAGLLPRPDIDPRAALGLASTMPAPARR